MDQGDHIRRERLIKYIKANNPLFLFACFDSYSIEKLEKLKTQIDEDIKRERIQRLTINLN